MEIRSYCGMSIVSIRNMSAQTATQGHLILSFPLFRPFKGWYLPRVIELACGGRRGGTPRHQEVNTVGFEPCSGDVAQLGEHLLCTQGVTGSSPVISTRTLSTE